MIFGRSLLILTMIGFSVAPSFAQTKEEIAKVTAITKRQQTNYSTLTFIADLALTKGDYKKAESCYKKMLDICKDDPGIGAKSAQYAFVLSQLALCSARPNTKDEAKKLSKEALSIIEGETPENDPQEGNYILMARRNCSQILGKETPASGPAKAPALQLKSIPKADIPNLAAREKEVRGFLLAHEKKGHLHPAYMKDLLYLANICTLEKKNNEALPMFKKAIALFEHKLGRNSPALLTPLSNYGYCLMQIGKTQDAESVLNRMQQIRTVAEATKTKHTGAKS